MGLLALVGLLVAAVLVAIGIVLHRDLAQINEQLERSGHQPELTRWLDQLWGDVQQMHDQHVKATDNRLRDIEATLAQARQHQAELARYVNWMAPLVQQWANATPDRRR